REAVAMITFDGVAAQFGSMHPPDSGPEDPWLSPYRLLFGAAYSMGRVEPLIEIGDLGPIPSDLSHDLKLAVPHSAESPCFPKGAASFLLTNGIFRVAAGAEKICSLFEPSLEEGRRALWTAVKQPTTAFSKKLPKAYELVGGTSRRSERKAHLQV